MNSSAKLLNTVEIVVVGRAKCCIAGARFYTDVPKSLDDTGDDTGFQWLNIGSTDIVSRQWCCCSRCSALKDGY